MTQGHPAVERVDPDYNAAVCTLTWFGTGDGYQLFFNRDERRERRSEVPPAVRTSAQTRFVAPLDGDFGGTWIAVNERGLALCLLNGFSAAGYDANPPPRAYTSRGMLPLSLIDSPSAANAAERVHALEPERFRPFLLVALEPGRGGFVARWSGSTLELENRPSTARPLVSSSFYTEQVRRNRASVFENLIAGHGPASRTEAHLAFHRAHVPCAGPHSPCMHRDDANTVSFSRVEVDAGEIRFHYVSHSPCKGLSQDPPIALPRRAASSR